MKVELIEANSLELCHSHLLIDVLSSLILIFYIKPYCHDFAVLFSNLHNVVVKHSEHPLFPVLSHDIN